MTAENKANFFTIYPVHQFGTRHNFFLGADREATMFVGLICFMVIFISIVNLFIPTIIVGILLWFVMIFILRRLAKYDPMIRFVYFRHIKYQKYYPAHSSPFRRCTIEYKSLTARRTRF